MLRLNNPFSFPGGNPRFSSSHPAAGLIAANKGYSVVATPNGMVSLANGTYYTLNGSPTQKILGSIGPTYLFASGQSATLAGPGGTPTNIVLAAIVQFSVVSGS